MQQKTSYCMVQGNFNLRWPKIILRLMLYNDQNFYYSKCKKALCFTLLLLKDVDLRKIKLKVFGKLNTWNSKMSIKGKTFVGIRHHSLCPTQKISFYIDSIQTTLNIISKIWLRCTNKEDGERKLPQPKVNTSKTHRRLFYLLCDVSWLLCYFGLLFSFTIVSGHFVH